MEVQIEGVTKVVYKFVISSAYFGKQPKIGTGPVSVRLSKYISLPMPAFVGMGLEIESLAFRELKIEHISTDAEGQLTCWLSDYETPFTKEDFEAISKQGGWTYEER
jgi:hypothetical protein